MTRRDRAVVPHAEFRSYYDRPVLKEPVWTWEVATYFFVGGLAAGSALLAAGSDLRGAAGPARRYRLVAASGAALGGALLVADLGRRDRFHHMLRVLKPTSPMSIGSWTLAAFGPAAGLAAVTDTLGVFPRIGRAAGLVAAALAPALASYTAVLVSDTAIPAWHEAYRELPFLFVGGAAASAGACGVILNPPAAASPARRLLLVGGAVELMAGDRLRRSLAAPVAAPYRSGRSGRWSRRAAQLTAVGLGVVVVAGRRRAGHAAGGAFVLAGAALERFAILEAGRISARDPRAVIEPQRARVAAGSPATPG